MNMSQSSQDSAMASTASVETEANGLCINCLPDDILFIIFSKLSLKDRVKIEIVCKRWKKIGEEGWPDIKKVEIKSNMKKHEIKIILQRCGKYIKCLNIPIADEKMSFLPLAKQYCQLDQLETLSMNYDNGTIETIQESCNQLPDFFAHCNNLKRFKIDGYGDGFDISCLEALPASLLELDVFENANEEENEFSLDLSKFVNLRKLDVSTQWKWVADELKGLGDLKNLVELKLYWRDMIDEYASDISRLEHLEVLELKAWKSYMDDPALSTIAKHCKKLKVWKMEYLLGMEGKCFKDIGKMPALETLSFKHMHFMNDKSFHHLTNVKKLSCTDSIEVKDAGVIRLLKNSLNLRKLKLIGTSITPKFFAKANAALQRSHNGTPLSLIVSKMDEKISPTSFPNLTIEISFSCFPSFI